jgi:hypothetical protein
VFVMLGAIGGLVGTLMLKVRLHASGFSKEHHDARGRM